MTKDPAQFLSPAVGICARLSWQNESLTMAQYDGSAGVVARECHYEVDFGSNVISVALPEMAFVGLWRSVANAHNPVIFPALAMLDSAIGRRTLACGRLRQLR